MASFSSSKNNYSREVIIKADVKGRITYVSESSRNILGYEAHELIGENIIEQGILKINRTQPAFTNMEFIRKDGVKANFDIHINRNEENEYILSVIDITRYIEYNKHKEELAEIVHQSKDIIYKIEAKPEFRFVYLSPYIEEILGHTLEEHYQNPNLINEIMHPEDKEYMDNKIGGKIDYSMPSIARYRHKNGNYVWLEDYCTPIYDESGEISGFQGVSRDITLRKAIEEKLRRKSYADSLTGLYNKTYLDRQIKKINKNHKSSLGVFFCDLDNLKIINDSIGHKNGDSVISYFAGMLKKVFGEESLLFRIGGDEFIIINKDISFEFMEERYCRLIKSLEAEKSSSLPIEASIGYSYCREFAGDIEKIIHEADENMYKNKKTKKAAI